MKQGSIAWTRLRGCGFLQYVSRQILDTDRTFAFLDRGCDSLLELPGHFASSQVRHCNG